MYKHVLVPIDLAHKETADPMVKAATRLAGCSRITQGGGATLPAALALQTGEVVIIAETCVERTTATTTRVLYSYYITPSRAANDPNLI